MKCGCDLVEVTAHAGASPEHAGWQGKVCSRSGKSKKYPSIVEATGYGTGPGLGGWNCRHNMFPYYEGTIRTYTDKELEPINGNDIIDTNDEKEVKEVQYIGKLDKNKLGKYKDKIVTDDIVLTDERKAHIYEDHANDYEKIINNLNRVILNPDEIIEDIKNSNTVLFIGKLEKSNLNVVIKLNTTNDSKHPQNSVMTAWIIRDKNLKKLREKNETIYKNE